MKKVFFITETKRVKGRVRYNYAHCYNRIIIATSHMQGFSRLEDAELSYDKNFKPGAKRIHLSRAEFDKLFRKKK